MIIRSHDAMKTVNLKVVHRLLLKAMLNEEGKGPGYSLSDLHKIFKVFDKIDFTPDEAKQFKLRNEENMVKWDAREGGTEDGKEIDIHKGFELSDEEVKLVCGMMKKKDEEKRFTTDGLSAVLELAEQFGYTFE
ncbi:hypothetical protein A2635_03990 [Candidatus Peribacteria bacterium RIFCSPHIGHO2_01_FULL_51_9]|nr:MAG: hypothetical protein A2635_03990 [Candidatus Peribacteria bacterium RIFCSPHIGHO2_01_FULL_51_9]